jgi:hypothetical protein
MAKVILIFRLLLSLFYLVITSCIYGLFVTPFVVAGLIATNNLSSGDPAGPLAILIFIIPVYLSSVVFIFTGLSIVKVLIFCYSYSRSRKQKVSS